MLTFQKAKTAFGEIRTMHLHDQPARDPIMWDLALGLHAMVTELDGRLSAIEHNQQLILQQLSRLK